MRAGLFLFAAMVYFTLIYQCINFILMYKYRRVKIPPIVCTCHQKCSQCNTAVLSRVLDVTTKTRVVVYPKYNIRY